MLLDDDDEEKKKKKENFQLIFKVLWLNSCFFRKICSFSINSNNK